ncbi:hypothetical protein LpeD_121 [Lactobacillus phage LpeD]|uniref:Uncharacterized protein n=1 Tax=Lactobacillus phage LpeD TaxID=2041210 RepID=A0A291I9K7_9CAUD|nr:hypothetical protein HWB32_gp075 [Lactobacillus phage LpeD]ATG86382.1 hypothetical protein LpeD_121 [Lactobacillus phage LpeD]
MGYTDGVAQRMSESSLKGTLFQLDKFTYQDDNFNENDLDTESLSDFLDDKIDLYQSDYADLLRDGYCYDDSENKVILTIENDGFTVEIIEDIYNWIDENSQGGLYYILDEDKDLVGARLGVCGEHIGQVSVWLDTVKGVFEQAGTTYSISDENKEAINDALEEMLDC